MEPTDIDRLCKAVVTKLPIRTRWQFNFTAIDFSFERAHAGIRHLAQQDVSGGPLEDDWLNLLIFGEADVADGGGAQLYLVVRDDGPSVYALDVEAEFGEQFQKYNSDIDRFIRTFLTIDGALRQGKSIPEDFLSIAATIDPEAFSTSEWPGLYHYVSGE